MYMCNIIYCEFAIARRVNSAWAKKHVNVEAGFQALTQLIFKLTRLVKVDFR